MRWAVMAALMVLFADRLVLGAGDRPAIPSLQAVRTLYVNPISPGSFHLPLITELKRFLPHLQILDQAADADASVELTVYYGKPGDSSAAHSSLMLQARVMANAAKPRELLLLESGTQTDLNVAAMKVADQLASALGGRDRDRQSSTLIPDDSGRRARPAVDAEELFTRAAELSMEGNFNAALPFWKRYLELVPRNSFAHYNLGLTYVGLQQWRLAADSFEKSARLNRHNDSAFFNLGFSYYQLSRWREARKALHDTLKINPGHEKARKLLELIAKKRPGSTHFEKGRTDRPQPSVGAAEPGLVATMSAGRRCTVEKIYYSSFQRILGSHDQDPIVLNQLFQNLRTVTQMVRRNANVRSDGLRHERVRMMREFCRQQRFYRWPHSGHDGAKIP